MVALRKKPASKPRTLRPRQELFARLIVSGRIQRDAYRQAYGQKKANDKTVDEMACRLARQTLVAERIAELQQAAASQVLLSRERRMQLMAEAVQGPAKTAAERNARARCVEVYNKTAGDCVPDPDEPATPAPGDELGKRRVLNVTVNIFQNSPATARKESADALAARLPAMRSDEKTENGNGHAPSPAANGQH